MDPASGVLASVPKPAETRHRGTGTQSSWCSQSAGDGSVNAAVLPCAQIHKGYLDDPRNTDNAWVETVAISVHFDNQNDVEMKRLNSVRASCLRGSLRWLLAGVGQVSPLSKADPSEQTAQAAIVPGGTRSVGMAGWVGLGELGGLFQPP